MWFKGTVATSSQRWEIVDTDSKGFGVGIGGIKGVSEVTEKSCALPAQSQLDE